MELNKENIGALLDSLLMTAKAERARIPYSQDEGMRQYVLAIGPNGEAEMLPIQWRDEREKYFKMKAVSKVAQDTLCSAVVLISDTRWTNSDKFGDYFHIPPVKEIGLEKWRKEYHTILGGMYGGLIKNLPRELWSEAVIVIIKGPRIKCESRMAPYVEGPNDTIQYTEETDSFAGIKEFNLLPDWWQ